MTTHTGVKAQELMIGNYLLFKFRNMEDAVIKVTQIADSFISCNEVAAIQYKHIEPIKLTEDWLEMFGFTKKHSPHYYTNASSKQERPLKIIVDPNEIDGVYVSVWDESAEIVLYQGGSYYVHQLQNLYFALTATSLTRTEDERK